jgi:3-oxoacyl-[acyl-carrier protein] reductase
VGEDLLSHNRILDAGDDAHRPAAGPGLGRTSVPQDVANACLYLASEKARLFSGVCLGVDGARAV